jgi:hypothetical protein
MPVTTETATVFRGGGRRWFTKASAINAEAKTYWRVVSKQKARCDCDTRSPSMDELEGYGEYTCDLHQYDNPVRKRYMRFAKHCIARATA